MRLVVRTLAVLRHLADRPEGQSLVELSGALDAPLPTLHRLMAVLVTQEFVVRSLKDKRYTLGPAAVSLNRGMRRVEEIARPHMAELSAQTQETVFLTEMVGRRAVCTALVDGSRPLRLSVRVGQELPIHAAASARAILAFLPEGEVDQLLAAHELVRFTDDTPHTVSAVKEHLDEVARRGFDVCDQELDLNVIAISAPVRSKIGTVTASLTLAAPRDRMSTLIRRRWTAQVLDAANAISTESGHSSAVRPTIPTLTPTPTRS